MEEQKRDMTGAAIMFGVMSQLVYFRPSIEVRAYLPCTENMIGSNAIKPGDVLRSQIAVRRLRSSTPTRKAAWYWPTRWRTRVKRTPDA